MSASRSTFEVQVQKEGRWIADIILDREDDARNAAARLFADRKCEGVRIFRNWLKADNSIIETQIHCETRIIRENDKLRIGLVDAIPCQCDTTDDYYNFASRQFMNRIFRAYCDKAFVTPTELLHDAREFKRLQDTETLVSSAVDRVAFLQTQDGTLSAKDRKDQIFKAIGIISARARKVEKLKLPKPTDSLSQVNHAIKSTEDDQDYLTMVALCRELLTQRSWLGKLDRLLALAEKETEGKIIHMLDGVISDVLMSNVMQDLLGQQPHLARAITRMFDLADGKFPAETSDAADTVAKLNTLLKGGLYPRSRTCIIDRAHRQIRAVTPLCRDGTEKELIEFSKLIERVLTPVGFISGPDTAEALTSRHTRLVIQGGIAGRKAAILGTFRAMPDLATGVIYLSELIYSEYAAEHTEDMMKKFAEVLQAKCLEEFCSKNLSLRDRLARATNAFQALSPTPFPGQTKDRVLAHIDAIIDRFLAEEKIIEKLDHADSSLRERAQRLVQFCAAGILPPQGKSITRTRSCILNLLRQPNFDSRFVEDLPNPATAQASLRDFHQLLVKAGFG